MWLFQNEVQPDPFQDLGSCIFLPIDQKALTFFELLIENAADYTGNLETWSSPSKKECTFILI